MQDTARFKSSLKCFWVVITRMTCRFIVADSLATVTTELGFLLAGGVHLGISVFVNIGVLLSHVQPDDRYLLSANLQPEPEVLVVKEHKSFITAT